MYCTNQIVVCLSILMSTPVFSQVLSYTEAQNWQKEGITESHQYSKHLRTGAKLFMADLMRKVILLDCTDSSYTFAQMDGIRENKLTKKKENFNMFLMTNFKLKSRQIFF